MLETWEFPQNGGTQYRPQYSIVLLCPYHRHLQKGSPNAANPPNHKDISENGEFAVVELPIRKAHDTHVLILCIRMSVGSKRIGGSGDSCGSY